MAPSGSAACSHDMVAAGVVEDDDDVPILVMVREESRPVSVGPAGSVTQLSERLAIAVMAEFEAAATVMGAAREKILISFIVQQVGRVDTSR